MQLHCLLYTCSICIVPQIGECVGLQLCFAYLTALTLCCFAEGFEGYYSLCFITECVKRTFFKITVFRRVMKCDLINWYEVFEGNSCPLIFRVEELKLQTYVRVRACMYVCVYVCMYYVCMYKFMYMYVCMYVCVYVCMYYVCMYKFMYMYVCMYVCVYVCMYYVCMYVCTNLCACMCIYMYVQIYVHACVYVRMYLYIYICIYMCVCFLCTYVYMFCAIYVCMHTCKHAFKYVVHIHVRMYKLKYASVSILRNDLINVCNAC